MSEDGLLARLAELAGIEARYRDEIGRMQTTSAESKRGVLRAMGFAVDSPGAIEASVRELEAAAWREVAPPVIVARAASPASLPVSLPASAEHGTLAWEIAEEGGQRRRGTARVGELPLSAASVADGGRFERRTLTLPDTGAQGFHRLALDVGDARHEVSLIATDGRCYMPPGLSRGPGAWGWAVQLYALRGSRDWGIGDYTRLREFVEVAAEQGAAAVGVNPLHVLSTSHPERASPYSPSSRALFTVGYIDVEACPELALCAPARARIDSAEFQEWLGRLRAEPLVHYRDVAAAKLEILALLYEVFRTLDAAAPRQEAFRRFQETSRPALRRWATFEALSRHFAPGARWWREWPAAYRDPDSAEVAAFAQEFRARIEYYEYLQWLAETQLAEVCGACDARGMPIGLYSDLALGVDHDSADVWGQGDLYAAAASIGAPPDVMNMRGQNWGIAPMNPLVLRRRGYQPLCSVLRASMHYGGALRIDHAMSLQRLYWIPEGAEPVHGAYVRQPFEDLIGVLALESTRERCMVIGEDLGTVPPGFRQRMQRARVLSYRPLFFQLDKKGEFIPPARYPSLSAAVVGTHDMATLPGYWTGRDLDVRRALGLRDTRIAGGDDEFARRTEEKRRLLAALAREGLLPVSASDAAGEMTDDLVAAIHAFLAGSPARLVMVRPEDALGIVEQHNLPGTVDEHANWRLRLPMDIRGFAADERLDALAEVLRRFRPARRKARRCKIK